MAQNPDESTLSDPMANLPRNPPIYKGTGFDAGPLERAAELSKSKSKVASDPLMCERLSRKHFFLDLSYGA